MNAFNVGALIALYERAVGFYASLVNINAYHQPGVEAGKKAATRVLELQKPGAEESRRRARKNRGGNRAVARGGPGRCLSYSAPSGGERSGDSGLGGDAIGSQKYSQGYVGSGLIDQYRLDRWR